MRINSRVLTEADKTLKRKLSIHRIFFNWARAIYKKQELKLQLGSKFFVIVAI